MTMKVSRGSTGSANRMPVRVITDIFDTYNVGEQGDINPVAATPAVATPIWSVAVGTQAIMGIIRNISTGGQIIRVGPTADWTVPSGMPLYPGDSLDVIQSMPWFAQGNVAGGILSRVVERTS